MKKIKVDGKYITNIELSCGKVIAIEFDDIKAPVVFREDDAEYIKTTLEEYYENKDIEIVIEDF